MIYFAADFHLGIKEPEKIYRQRLHKINLWLKSIEKNATELYLLGDIFEFWYEWKYVIPKPPVSFLSALYNLSTKGIKINFFVGNHDLWAKDFFEKELNIKVFHRPQIIKINGKKFFIAHGDGLINTEKKYTFIKKYVFLNTFVNFIFGRLLHPDRAIRVAMKFSNPKDSKSQTKKTLSPELKQAIVDFTQEIDNQHNIDYFIFGHFHRNKILNTKKNKIILLGDWLTDFSYAFFDGNELIMKEFDN